MTEEQLTAAERKAYQALAKAAAKVQELQQQKKRKSKPKRKGEDPPCR